MENVTKCPAKSKRKPPLCNFRVIGQAWIRVTVYVSSRIIVRRTLYYLYLPYVSPEGMIKFTRRATGHFVTLIEIAMHLITCISGHLVQNAQTCFTFRPQHFENSRQYTGI